MPPQMLARIIFIFTLITGIVFSAKTYWSKRSGQPEFSNFIYKDAENSKETEKNENNLTEYGTHEQKRKYLVSQQIESNRILPLPYMSFSTFLRQIKYVLHNMDID